MWFKSNVSKETIQNVVENRFDLSVYNLELVPVGEMSQVYHCYAGNDSQYIVKIVEELKNHTQIIDRFLYDVGYEFKPQSVISKNDKIWERHWFRKYSVEKYVTPRTEADGFYIKDEYLPALGEALSQLHSINSLEKLQPQLQKQSYIPKYYDGVETLLRKTKKNKLKQYPKIQDILITHKDALNNLLSRSIEYGKKLQRQNFPVVLVHGDIHADNVLISENNDLYIIDWDSVSLSYAEHDLMYFDDRQIKLISEGYGRYLLKHRDAIEYYRCYLKLRGIYFFVHSLGMEGENTQEKERGIKQLDTFCNNLDKNNYAYLRE